VALALGIRLGPYEVTAQIGVGGMGEVYRATDTNLARQVAIKVLPDAVAQDSERLARFDREARTLAALNHPNIAAIYGLAEGPTEAGHYMRALVMELVEGPTLADRIAQGAISLDEALPIAKQIAEALEAAHEQGIIHRDLKPANVKVRPDGTVKLLDFGLAKALESGSGIRDQGSGGVSLSPTITSPAMMTGVGMILGTAAYMSPEQARGREVDRRADIWAFGAVLFEMLTGRRPFDGEDITEVVGAVVRLEPDWARLPATVPPRIRQVIRACLQKNVKQRIAHMQDVRLALDGAFETSVTQPDVQTARVVARPLWRRALPMVATAVVVAAITAGAARTLRPQEPRPVVRSAHELPQGRFFMNPAFNVLAIASDGRQFVYNSTAGLNLRAMDSIEDRSIPGTEPRSGITSPFFSPDGQSVGFFDLRDQSLYRVPVGGGTLLRLAKAGFVYGLNWERDGTILYGQADGIWQVSENGGDARRVIATKSGEQAFAPRRLPGGDWVLFTVARGAGSGRWDEADIVVQSVASGERRVLRKGGSDARYVPTGHLVFGQGATLYAMPFDLDGLKVIGAPVPVVQGVRGGSSPGTSSADAFYGFSTNGTLVYVPGAYGGNALGSLAWVDQSGRRQAINMPAGQYQHPRLSPDGKWLAVERQNGGASDIWLYDVSGTAAERRLTEGGNNRYPVWSGDSAYLVFQSDREGDRGVFRQRADGTGVVERLTMPGKEVEHIPEDWSLSEDRLAFSVVSGSNVELWMWTLADRSAKRVGTLQSTAPFDAVFHPRGKWIAYTERSSGGVGTYVQAVTSNDRYQIGRVEDVVHHPLWSHDGKRLIYFPSAAVAVAVEVRTEPTFAVGRPQPLPGDGLPLNVQPSTLLNHDVGPDGRFVTILAAGAAANAAAVADKIVIVQNWFEELKRLVPTR
jgi:eukaryotic-like serine/threonine-protein kinase